MQIINIYLDRGWSNWGDDEFEERCGKDYDPKALSLPLPLRKEQERKKKRRLEKEANRVKK